MGVMYSILKKQMLTISEKHLIVSIGKNHLKYKRHWFIYSIELSKIYYIILFLMKKSHVMTEIHLG